MWLDHKRVLNILFRLCMRNAAIRYSSIYIIHDENYIFNKTIKKRKKNNSKY